jgi:hypothetical protein
VGVVFWKPHKPCIFKTSFVDLEKEWVHCSRFISLSILSSGSQTRCHSCTIPTSLLYIFYSCMMLNLLSLWICMKYLPLDIKQPTISQSYATIANKRNLIYQECDSVFCESS